ncbi:MAG: flotillin-like FloA family protein [Chitinophagales bacterium]
METGILIVFLLLFLAFLFALPLLVTKFKAAQKSANLTLKEALLLTIRKTAKPSLFQVIAIVQQYGLNITIAELEAHLLSSGNPQQVVAVLAKNQENPEATFQLLTILDLAGENLEEAVQKAEKIYQITISCLQVNDFEINYNAKFKYGLSRWFSHQEEKKIEQQIRETLTGFAANWTSKSPTQTKSFIHTMVLNNKYWDKIIGVQLIEQNIILK